MEYQYEQKLEGSRIPGVVRPDFTFVDPSGARVIWEHLGMMSRDDYRTGWDWKRQWYLENDFIEGKNLFTTKEDERGGLSSADINATLKEVRSRL
jgi:hypothetical protein